MEIRAVTVQQTVQCVYRVRGKTKGTIDDAAMALLAAEMDYRQGDTWSPDVCPESQFVESVFSVEPSEVHFDADEVLSAYGTGDEKGIERLQRIMAKAYGWDELSQAA